MKKITLLISGLVLSTIVSTTSAQQLRNSSFTDWKTACGSSDQINDKGKATARQRPGVEPTDWNGSNVKQVVSIFTGQSDKLVTKEASGYTSNSVCLTNVKVEALGIGAVAPGYVTFGTPWVYASATLSDCDGGTYGGMDFSYRPDAVSAYFKRTATNPSENSYVITYLWNGTFESKVGKKSGPNGIKNDVDRAVLAGIDGIPAAADVKGNGTLVAYCNYSFTSTTNNDWQELTIPLKYENASTVPSKMNLIICAGDYWNRDALVENTRLYVDDVKYLYYSRLSSLSVGGYEVPVKDVVFNQDGVCNCVAYVANPTSHTATVLGEAPTKGEAPAKIVSSSNDPSNNTYSVTVTNKNNAADATDIDGLRSHTYKVKYMSQTTGYAAAFNNGIPSSVSSPIPVDYMKEADGTYALTFGNDEPDFEFEFDDAKGTRTPSRTVITGVTMTVDSKGCYVFTKNGATQGRDYTVSLVNDGDTKCIYDPKGDGRWIFNFDVNYDGCVTRVTVTSHEELSGVNGMNSMKERVVARSGAIEVSGFDGVAEVYTIDGRLVAKTAVAGNAQIAASNGIYLVRTPNTVKKVIVR